MKKKRPFYLIVMFFVFSVFLLTACGGGSDVDTGSSAPGNNADLADLTLSTGILNTAFDSGTIFYSVDSVTDNTITVTPVSSDANASISVNGNSVSSGSASVAVSLSIGANIISLVVTAEDGSTAKTYNITVNRIASSNNNANLSSLAVSAGVLDPVFGKDVLAYTVTVSNATTSATITATLFDTFANFVINGSAGLSDAASSPLNLNVGSNQFDIVVTAGDGVTTKTYIVTIIRAALTGSNVDLSGLSISLGSLDQAFLPSLMSYTTTVKFLIASLRVTASVSGNEVITVNNIAASNGQVSQDITLAEGSNVINVKVTSADGLSSRTYTIAVNRDTANVFAQQAYIKSTNPFSQLLTSTFGGLGISFPSLSKGVAIDGDTLAIGVANDNFVTDDFLGGVYIFQRVGGVWIQQTRLSSNIKGDFFGASVDLSGDTLVVGAFIDSSNAVGINQDRGGAVLAGASGAVYVFRRTNSVWSQEAFIKASNTDQGDQFGWSVAISGNTLVVGANREGSAAAGIGGDQTGIDGFDGLASGAVYVFERSASTWSQQAYVKASNSGRFDSFGAAVELFNNTLVVSSVGEDSDALGLNGDEQNDLAQESGAVYVFIRNNTTWSQQAYIKSDNAAASGFGISMSLFENTLAVGETNERAVYVYTGADANWSKQSVVKGNPLVNERFGGSVDLYRDTLVVGAMGDFSGASGINGDKTSNAKASSGAVYMFARNNSNWSEQAYIKASNPDTSDRFGNVVAVSEDTVAITASGESDDAIGVGLNEDAGSGFHVGAVYIFQ